MIDDFVKNNNITETDERVMLLKQHCEKCIRVFIKDAKSAVLAPCAQCNVSIPITKMTVHNYILYGDYRGKKIMYIVCKECRNKLVINNKVEEI